jgi:flagellin-like hook-associated protein FlgL
MSVGSIGGSSQAAVRRLVEMRQQFDDLQRQLGTGKKSATYAGQGLNSGLGVALRSQLSGLSAFDQTMTTVGIRLNLAQSALMRMTAIGSEAKTALAEPAELGANGQAKSQTIARGQLDELVDLLSSQIDGRYLFSGRNVDQPSVATSAQILDGDGVRAGLKQMISERRQADLGANGLGRLNLAAVGNVVTLNEDAAGSPFGLKISAASTDIPGAGVTGPSGAPNGITITFGATAPVAGQSVSVTFALPDGTSQTLRLTATASATPGPGEFTIGADAAATASNFQTALGASVTSLASTSLVAASAMATANSFFNVDVGQTPQRVVGPPFDTATALTAATSADTVIWYTGETSSDPARSSASARIEGNLSVDYGLRANEEGIRALVRNVAVFAATTFSSSDPAATAAYGALVDRVRTGLEGSPTTQKIQEIAADIGSAQATVKSVQDRHKQTSSVLAGLLEGVEGVSTEDVAMQMLTLQNRLQASLQTTAILYKLNLADYI